MTGSPGPVDPVDNDRMRYSAGADRWHSLLPSYTPGLVELHGQPGWVAALTPLSVDGMIVAASTRSWPDSRSGRKGGALPWALLVASSVASLAANMAVAEPSLIGRVIAAWPSFALIASDELLMRQVRRAAEPGKSRQRSRGVRSRPEGAQSAGRPGVRLPDAGRGPTCDRRALLLRRGGGLRRGSCARTAASARSAATHWCHSRECHERLPPSPALSRSMAG